MAGLPFTAYSATSTPGLYRFERGTKPPVELYGPPAEEYKRQIDNFNRLHAVAQNAHGPQKKPGLSFEDYETAGYSKAPNRAMAQAADWEAPGQSGFARVEARSSPDARRVEAGEQAERMAAARKDPRAGGAGQAFLRSAVTRAVDSAALPVTAPAKALQWAGVPNRVADLSAEEAWADAESLARNETTAQARERGRLTREAHPTATVAGEAVGDVAAGAATLGLEKALRGGRMFETVPADQFSRSRLLADESGSVKLAPSPTTAKGRARERIQEDRRERASERRLSASDWSDSKIEKYGVLDGRRNTLLGTDEHGLDADVAFPMNRAHRYHEGVAIGEREGQRTLHEGQRALRLAAKQEVLSALKRGNPAELARLDPVVVQGLKLEGRISAEQADEVLRLRKQLQENKPPEQRGVARMLSHLIADESGAARLVRSKPPPVTPVGQVYIDDAAAAPLAKKTLGYDITPESATRLIGHDPRLKGEVTYSVARGTHSTARGEQVPTVTITMRSGDASIERSYRREGGKLIVNHDVFRLPKALPDGTPVRKQGIGKNVLRQQIEEYDRIGVDRIEMLAADEGRAVWPTMGFGLKHPEDFPRIRAMFDDYLREEGIDPSSVSANTVQEIARYNEVPVSSMEPVWRSAQTAQNIAQYGGAGATGREFLLKRAPVMSLALDLKGPDAARVRSYLGVTSSSAGSGASRSAQAKRSSARSADRLDSGGAGGAAGGGTSSVGISPNLTTNEQGASGLGSHLSRLLADDSGAAKLPAFDRRSVQSSRAPRLTQNEGTADTHGPARLTIVPERPASHRLAERALARLKRDPYFDPRDNPLVKQIEQAKQFHAENPDYTEQAEAAARFFARHPDTKALAQATVGNYSMNTELRLLGERKKKALESTPSVPRKDPKSGKIYGGTSHVRPREATRIAVTRRALEDAARAGHAYRGTSYRGLALPRETLDEWLAKGFVNQDSMWSASASEKVAAGNAPRMGGDHAGVILRLNGRSGVPIEGISRFPEESEIAFPPGRKWQIKNVARDEDGRYIIDAQEVDRIPDGLDAPHSAQDRTSDRKVV